MIENKKTRQQALYKEGDVLQGVEEVQVKKILRRKVILSSKGEDLELEIHARTGSKSRSRSTSSRRYNRPAPNTGSNARPNANSVTTVRSATSTRDIRLRVHRKSGQVDGVMAFGMRPGSTFRKMGLRNGDIIREIDGMALDSAEDANARLDDARQASTVTFSILRRGKPTEVVYPR